MSCSITLSTSQMERAAAVADELHSRLRSRGVGNAHGLKDKDATLELEAGGAQAELAASLMLGVCWTAGMNDDRFGPDIGTRTQVRSSNKPRRSHCLIIRQRDIDKYGNVPFLLVIQTGNTFRVHGWMMAQEAAQDKFLWDGGDTTRPKAWFVPERFLHKVDEMEGMW
jgi:hypothetical protein